MDQSLIEKQLGISQVIITQTVNAAIVNVSGRQRMLSQRAAMFSLRLACSENYAQRDRFRQKLRDIVNLMEKSHQGLIHGDEGMHLPGNPSPIVQSLYFESPFNLDRQVRQYIAEIRALLEVTDSELTLENPHLQWILKVASDKLLEALDQVVNQYQKESEAEQRAILTHQADLYHESCSNAAIAQAQAQELQKILANLHQTQGQLIQAEKMSSLGQLVAGVAHEINNPVNFIYGNLHHADTYLHDLLRLLKLYQNYHPNPAEEVQSEIVNIDLEFLQEDFTKLMDSMKLGSERIRQIVLSLRNFSRIDESDAKAVDIHEGIESTLLILKHRLQPKGKPFKIQIIKDYEKLPLVKCYPGQLNQVFMNILVNAIDALEENHLQVQDNDASQIKICTSMIKPKWVQVLIADNGLGIPQQLQSRVFDPFFTTKPVGKGTGMGMSISYQIITNKHGGELKFVSTPGKGTEFIVKIPANS